MVQSEEGGDQLLRASRREKQAAYPVELGRGLDALHSLDDVVHGLALLGASTSDDGFDLGDEERVGLHGTRVGVGSGIVDLALDVADLRELEE